MIVALLIGFFIGAISGATIMLVAVRKQASRPAPRKIEHKPIIHMRGHEPAWFGSKYCEGDFCVTVEKSPGVWERKNACYVDQDGRYWCERHLPKTTKVADRASRDITKDGHCVTHDYKCPRPWEPY